MALGNKEIVDLSLVPDSANAQLYCVKSDTDYRVGIGLANGIAQLDATGKVPVGQLPAGTAAWGSLTGTLSDQTDLNTALGLKAPLASPTFTGVPLVPTAAVNTNTTQAASTAYVVAQIADDAPSKTGTGASGTWGISITGNAGTASSAAQLTTSRTISLTGDVTGSVAFNGTANVAIAAVVGNDTHTHTTATISNMTAVGEDVATAASEDAARDAIGIYVQASDPGAVPDGSVWLW